MASIFLQQVRYVHLTLPRNPPPNNWHCYWQPETRHQGLCSLWKQHSPSTPRGGPLKIGPGTLTGHNCFPGHTCFFGWIENFTVHCWQSSTWHQHQTCCVFKNACDAAKFSYLLINLCLRIYCLQIVHSLSYYKNRPRFSKVIWDASVFGYSTWDTFKETAFSESAEHPAS